MELTAEQIAQMLVDKRCPECDTYVEYHRVESDGRFDDVYCSQQDEDLIYHFNYDEVMGELR